MAAVSAVIYLPPLPLNQKMAGMIIPVIISEWQSSEIAKKMN